MKTKGFAALELLLGFLALAILAGGVWVWQNQRNTTTSEITDSTIARSKLSGYLLFDQLVTGEGKILYEPAAGGETRTLFDLNALKDKKAEQWTVEGMFPSYEKVLLQNYNNSNGTWSLWEYDLVLSKTVPVPGDYSEVIPFGCGGGAKLLYPCLSPNEESLAYINPVLASPETKGYKQESLYLQNIKTGSLQKVDTDTAIIQIRGWSSDSKYLYFTKEIYGRPLDDKERSNTFYQVKADSGQTERLMAPMTDTREPLFNFLFSPKGGKFLRKIDQTLELIDVQGLQLINSYTPIGGFTIGENVHWTNDGKFITVVSSLGVVILDEDLQLIKQVQWLDREPQLPAQDIIQGVLMSPDGQFFLTTNNLADNIFYIPESLLIKTEKEDLANYGYNKYKPVIWLNNLPPGLQR